MSVSRISAYAAVLPLLVPAELAVVAAVGGRIPPRSSAVAPEEIVPCGCWGYGFGLWEARGGGRLPEQRGQAGEAAVHARRAPRRPHTRGRPWKPYLSDVDTLINLELGSAMRVTVVKLDDTSFRLQTSHSTPFRIIQ